MKIEHAFTYQYETKHFGKMLEHAPVKEGSCFDNVINFCKLYKELSRNTSVSLVLGLRGWDNACTMGYHYLVKDDDTGEFTDPQYSRYTFIELHNWSLEDYVKECNEFEQRHGERHSSEFYQWYKENGFYSPMLNALKLIKSLASYRIHGLSDKAIKEYINEYLVSEEPRYGTQVIQFRNLD